MYESFKQQNFRKDSLDLIAKCDRIITDYQAQGFTLTLRQLYYQLVSRDIVENTVRSYKRIGDLINNARLAGMIDWDGIEDRTRNLKSPSSWSSPEQILAAVASQYQEDPWLKQAYAPEIWIEKDALIGVIEPVCRRMRVPYFACRGFTSQSEVYTAGKRFAQASRRGRVPIVFHLGDHDPSGLDMTRDNEDRIQMFAGESVEVRRIALNMTQIEEYNPPPNPAKDTDSRFIEYQARYGDTSWELDALEPKVIDALIQDHLNDILNQLNWNASLEAEANRKVVLQEITDNFEAVGRFFKHKDEVLNFMDGLDD